MTDFIARSAFLFLRKNTLFQGEESKVVIFHDFPRYKEFPDFFTISRFLGWQQPWFLKAEVRGPSLRALRCLLGYELQKMLPSCLCI